MPLSKCSEMENIQRLIRERYQTPSALHLDREIFLAGITALDSLKCIWCKHTNIVGELLRLLSFPENDCTIWLRKKTADSLSTCASCIESYYKVRSELKNRFAKIYEPDTLSLFWHKVDEFDIARVGKPLEMFLVGQATYKNQELLYAIYELFLYPRHLQSTVLHDYFVNVLLSLIESKKMIKLNRMLPGIFYCLYDKNCAVINWAKAVFKDLSPNPPGDNFIAESVDYEHLFKASITDEGEFGMDFVARWLPTNTESSLIASLLESCIASYDHHSPSALRTIPIIFERFKNVPSVMYKQFDFNLFFSKIPIQILLQESDSISKLSVLMTERDNNEEYFNAIGKKLHSMLTPSMYNYEIICNILFKLVTVTTAKSFARYAACDIAKVLEAPFLDHQKSIIKDNPTLLLDLASCTLLIDLESFSAECRSNYAPYKQIIHTLMQFCDEKCVMALMRILSSRMDKWVVYCKEQGDFVKFLIKNWLSSSIMMREESIAQCALGLYCLSIQSDKETLGNWFKSYPHIMIKAFDCLVTACLEDAMPLALSYGLLEVAGNVIKKELYYSKHKTILDCYPERSALQVILLKALVGLVFQNRWCLDESSLSRLLLTQLNGILELATQIFALENPKDFKNPKMEETIFNRNLKELFQYWNCSNIDHKLLAKILIFVFETAAINSVTIDSINVKLVGISFSSLKVDQISSFNLDKALNHYEKVFKLFLPRPLCQIAPPPISSLPILARRGDDRVKIHDGNIAPILEQRILANNNYGNLEGKRKESNLSSTLLPNQMINIANKPASKLDLLKADAIRDFKPIANSSRKRATEMPIANVSKLEKLNNRVSSASESEGEEFGTIKGKFTRIETTADQPARSVKLINIADPLEQRRSNLSKKENTGTQCDINHIRRFQKRLLEFDLSQLEISVGEEALSVIPDSFSSISHYVSVFEPLLFLECRAQLSQSLEETSNDPIQVLEIVGVAHIDDFYELQLAAKNENDDRLRLNDQDYLILYLDDPVIKVAGIIAQTSFRAGQFEITVRLQLSLENAKVQIQFRNGLQVRFRKVGNMITNLREYNALHALENINLASFILQPKLVPISKSILSDEEACKEPSNLQKVSQAMGINKSQAKAILAVTKQVNPIVLIQGPPGTGKTRTIEVLVGFLLAKYKGKRILICAPSNAAIDEIVRRIRRGLCASDGTRFTARILRVGAQDMIAPDVQDLTLESSIEKLMSTATSTSTKLLDEQRQRCEKLKKSLVEAERDNQNDRVKTLKTNLWEAKENMRKNTKFIEDTRATAKQKILNESQIVCCTLSSSGHEILSRIEFDTVILDEACQAVELSCLVPLQHNCQRCVLVGDPNQLPPTVISQMAGVFSYEQSLFARLQKHCPDSVLLLDTQYRMHPEISRFPNSYFYEGRLVDGPEMERLNHRPWHSHQMLKPFVFFDVSGREDTIKQRSGMESKSKLNELEARIAVNLVALVCQNAHNLPMAGKIGIVTPYRDQRRALRRELGGRFGSHALATTEISTVDGFQGQEREVIIFSCVRTADSHGIGFLNDTRRLNVALTRAKCSLFVLGKSSSLMRNPIWKAMIEDAKSRNCFVPFNSRMWDEADGIRTLSNMHINVLKQEEKKDLLATKAPVVIKSPAERGMEKR